jgi:hypothetical protein
MCHQGLHAGHPGYDETLRSILHFGWWPDLETDIAKWCRECYRCQVGKTGGVTLDFNHGRAYPPTHPFSKITINFEGPFPMTAHGNTHFCVIQDEATRFRIIVSVDKAGALTAAHVLFFEVIVVFGVPLIIGHDQGRDFESQFFAAINAQLGITQQSSVAYQPQMIA